MERKKIYDKYIGLFIKQETFNNLAALADKKGYCKGDKNSLGEKLKQPKKYVSTLIREIVEEYLTKK